MSPFNNAGLYCTVTMLLSVPVVQTTRKVERHSGMTTDCIHEHVLVPDETSLSLSLHVSLSIYSISLSLFLRHSFSLYALSFSLSLSLYGSLSLCVCLSLSPVHLSPLSPLEMNSMDFVCMFVSPCINCPFFSPLSPLQRTYVKFKHTSSNDLDCCFLPGLVLLVAFWVVPQNESLFGWCKLVKKKDYCNFSIGS